VLDHHGHDAALYQEIKELIDRKIFNFSIRRNIIHDFMKHLYCNIKKRSTVV
jgi:hypothetical protein